jgi:hypothetical protein
MIDLADPNGRTRCLQYSLREPLSFGRTVDNAHIELRTMVSMVPVSGLRRVLRHSDDRDSCPVYRPTSLGLD